jgi:hypothetical protein
MSGIIASLAWKRQTASVVEWKKIGAIWYLDRDIRCGLLMNGFRQGIFSARPKRDLENPPFLRGDVIYKIKGQRDDDDSKVYVWLGFMWTEQFDNGDTIYGVSLEVIPPFTVGERGSVFLPVLLDDREKRIKENEEKDDLPL